MADEAPDNSAEFVELNMTPAPEGDQSEAPPPADDTPPEGEQPEPKEGEDKPEGDKDGENEDPLREPNGRFKGGASGRINELTRARREAERAADYWKGIATRNGAASGDNAAPTSKPTADQFEDYGAYVEALTDWKVEDRARQTADTNAKQATEAAQGHREAEWGAKLSAAKAADPDFDAVMAKADTPTAPHVADAILDADRGPELLKYLALNPDVVGKLNDMSANRAAIELGRIEATLDAPAEAPKPRDTKTTKAPAPITPVQPGATTTKDPAKMDMDEYKAYRATKGIR